MAVHDVVVLDDVFTHIKVEAFNFFLGIFQTPGNHSAFNWRTLVYLEPIHYRGNLFAAVDTHQVILARYVKLSGSRIALAAGAAAELVVNAPRLMALGTQHEQTTQTGYAFTEHYVGSSPSNVGRQRYGALLAGLGDNCRLSLVVLGI